VEVSFSENDEVESWWEGEIIQGKGGFFMVSFPDQVDASTDILERERLRPAYGHTLAVFDKLTFPIRPEQQADVKITEDSLAKVAKLADLFALRLSDAGDHLIALGRSKALQTAKGIIEMHLKKVSDKAKKYRIALDLQTKVKAEQSKLSNGIVVSFNVDRDSIGKLIGTGGANIRTAKRLPGINRIDVTDDGVVNIFAESREKAEAAWSQLEVVTVVVPVKQDEVGFIIGKKGQQIQELEQMSGCHMNVTSESSSIVISGSRAGTEKAQALLEYILENLEEQRQKEEEIVALSGELRSMGVHNVGFFGSNVRGGNPRARGRLGRGAASMGRGAGGAGYGAGQDALGAQYSEPAGPERFGPARGGAVFARGGRGGRGRGAPAYSAGAVPAYNAGGAPAYNAGGAPAYNAGPAYSAGAGQSTEAHTYTGDARGAGRGANGSVAAVQRAQGVVVTLSGLHPPAPAPRQPLPPAATQPQGAQQRQPQPQAAAPMQYPPAPSGSAPGRGAPANVQNPAQPRVVPGNQVHGTAAVQQEQYQQPAVPAPTYKARGGSSAKSGAVRPKPDLPPTAGMVPQPQQQQQPQPQQQPQQQPRPANAAFGTSAAAPRGQAPQHAPASGPQQVAAGSVASKAQQQQPLQPQQQQVVRTQPQQQPQQANKFPQQQPQNRSATLPPQPPQPPQQQAARIPQQQPPQVKTQQPQPQPQQPTPNGAARYQPPPPKQPVQPAVQAPMHAAAPKTQHALPQQQMQQQQQQMPAPNGGSTRVVANGPNPAGPGGQRAGPGVAASNGSAQDSDYSAPLPQRPRNVDRQAQGQAPGPAAAGYGAGAAAAPKLDASLAGAQSIREKLAAQGNVADVPGISRGGAVRGRGRGRGGA